MHGKISAQNVHNCLSIKLHITIWNTVQFTKVSRRKFNFSNKHTHVIVTIIKCNDINKLDILMNENSLYLPPHGATRCQTVDNAFFSLRPTWALSMQPNTIPRPPVVSVCVDVRKSYNLNFQRVDFALIMPLGHSLSFPLSNAAWHLHEIENAITVSQSAIASVVVPLPLCSVQ